MNENTKINWRVHYIELRSWIEQNPKAALLLGAIALLFVGMIAGAVFW